MPMDACPSPTQKRQTPDEGIAQEVHKVALVVCSTMARPTAIMRATAASIFCSSPAARSGMSRLGECDAALLIR